MSDSGPVGHDPDQVRAVDGEPNPVRPGADESEATRSVVEKQEATGRANDEPAGHNAQVRAWMRLRRGAKRRPWLGWALVVGVGGLLVIVLWLLRTRVPESFPPSSVEVVEQTLPPLGAYTLYFGNPEATGLQREVRFLPRFGELEVDARNVIEALFEGSLAGGRSPWPHEATVQDIFVSGSGVLFVNFGGSVRWLSLRGDLMEWVLAGSLTRSLCENFPDLRGVRILIDGESTGRLGAQVSLEWVLTPAMFTEAP